jgi:exodeoxyribonuclease V gamma subunit
VLRAFVRILHLAGSRLGAAAVVELLETPAVRRRFALGEADVRQARQWLRDAGVRWGRDEVHRAALQLPALRQNTWADGLDRLLLGYAMSTETDQLFQGILPCDGPEGQASDILGRLLDFTNKVFATVRLLEAPRSLAAWVVVLRQLVDDFFLAGEADELEIGLLREILTELDEQAVLAATDEAMALPVILEHLSPSLADDRLRGGFLAGRVTFGALKPMRSIPFKIICLLGLNDAAFPRNDPRLGFDLMALEPQLGDQSKREDDRYLFLETILSARQRLYVSYVGQSIRDNAPAPPSVLVSELLDYVNQAYPACAPSPSPGASTPATVAKPAAPNSLGPVSPMGLMSPLGSGRRRGARRGHVPENQLDLNFTEFRAPSAGTSSEPLAARGIQPAPEPEAEFSGESLVRHHRLQAFSPEYFTRGGRLFSYSAENLEGCRALSGVASGAPFVRQPLPEPEEDWRTLDLDRLTEFFVNPAKFFLTRRLGVRLPRPEAELIEREPMELEGRDYFDIKDELLERRLAGENLAALLPSYLAGGRLPLGPLGALRFGELCDSIEELSERLARYRPQERLDMPDLDLVLGRFHLTGRFPHVTSLAVLHYRAGPVGPKDRIRTWVRHLAWSADLPRGGPRHSVMLGEPARASTAPGVQYKPIAAPEARQFLEKLLALYWRGLTEPLRFFPKTSLKFAEIDSRNADRGPDAWKDSLLKAQKEWESHRFKDGEMDDEYFKICFQDFNPLDGDFIALARQIGEPLIAHEGPASENPNAAKS